MGAPPIEKNLTKNSSESTLNMYAVAAQNQSQKKDFCPREVAPVVGPSVKIGAGATPADGTNRDSDRSDSPCCPPPSRGGFCSASPTGERAVASPSLSLRSGCESRALPCLCSTSESDRRAWVRYTELWRRISRLEIESLYSDEPSELRSLRAEQTALITQVDRHLDHCRGQRAL